MNSIKNYICMSIKNVSYFCHHYQGYMMHNKSIINFLNKN